MLRKEFRDAYTELVLDFLWRQWSSLGVPGRSASQENRVIDPEALLVLTLEFSLRDPRLFDEVLSWLIINGEWIDTSRLQNILKSTNRHTVFIKVLGGVIQYVSNHGNERKWKSLLKFCSQTISRNSQAMKAEALFLTRDQKPFPLIPENVADPDFLKFFINRPEISLNKGIKKVNVNCQSNIRFLLRRIFGVGSKSECILYLLTHEGGTPKEIADEIGIFWLSVQQVLGNLSYSGVVLKKRKGRRIEYQAKHHRWFEFLSSISMAQLELPVWINWIRVGIALSDLLTALGALVDFGEKNEEYGYLLTSKIQDYLEVLCKELGVPNIPTKNVPPDLYQKKTLEFLRCFMRSRKIYQLFSLSKGGRDYLETIQYALTTDQQWDWIKKLDHSLDELPLDQIEVLKEKIKNLNDRNQLLDKLSEVMVGL